MTKPQNVASMTITPGKDLHVKIVGADGRIVQFTGTKAVDVFMQFADLIAKD